MLTSIGCWMPIGVLVVEAARDHLKQYVGEAEGVEVPYERLDDLVLRLLAEDQLHEDLKQRDQFSRE
jgi:hypothetical protein